MSEPVNAVPMRGSILKVEHRTTYRYRSPVRFGDHRLMFRPRDSHDLRLLDTFLSVRPAASVRWLHDVFGNSIAIARFTAAADEMVFDLSFRVKPYPIKPEEIEFEREAQRYPFAYAQDEMPDLECSTLSRSGWPHRRLGTRIPGHRRQRRRDPLPRVAAQCGKRELIPRESE